MNGIILGSIYALIALGYSLVYGILKLLNFAHGDVYMIGSFIGFGVLHAAWRAARARRFRSRCSSSACSSRQCSARACSALAIERFAYRPLRDAPRIAPLISALGVAFFLENSALLLFGADYRNYDGYDLISYNGIHLGGDAGVFVVQYLGVLVHIGAPAADGRPASLSSAGPRFGKAMRAVAFDREAAAMMGIDPDRVIAMTFFLGSALGGRGRGDVRPGLQPDHYLVGFLAGSEGIHGGRRRWHRKHPGSDARRPPGRAGRVLVTGT